MCIEEMIKKENFEGARVLLRFGRLIIANNAGLLAILFQKR